MTGPLYGKTALVTGAARGVGREIALGLAKSGADVAILDRCRPLASTPYPMAQQEDLDDVRRSIVGMERKCLTLQADVTDLREMQLAVERIVTAFEHLDVVVANAGIFTYARLWELSEQQWNETIDVNLKGTWVTLKVVVPHMIARSSGRIICISSTAGLRGGAMISHYAASKHGVVGLVRSLAIEVGSYGITVNAVCPSRMKTPMVTYGAYYETFAGPGATEDDLDRVSQKEQVLPGPMVPITAVRDAVLWLSSDAAACITGCAVPVDAGEMLV